MKRKGLELLGVIPHQGILSSPTVDLIREELKAELLNSPAPLQNLVEAVVVGAMSVHNAINYFTPRVLVIIPGDREDIILAAAAKLYGPEKDGLAGIVLTDDLRPPDSIMKLIKEMPFPVLLAADDSYQVASKVHDLNVKTRPGDVQKISLIRDLIATHVDISKILELL